MDPALLPFVIRVVDKLTWRLPNLAILCHGLKDRLSWSTVGGIEVLAAKYASRYWYDLRVYRNINRRASRADVGDPEFFADAAGFVAFIDGSPVTTEHVRAARATGKKVKVYELT